MEINTYSQNTYYQTQTTSKAKNNNSANFESFADKIDTSNSTPKPPVVYDERAALARYPYFQMHPEAIEIEINYQHFVKRQEQLPWEEQLVCPTFAAEVFDYFFHGQEELLKDDWLMAMRGVTNGNKYDNAPEFKAFVDKWMANGLTENEALDRACIYVGAGLLDYGSQRATMLGGGMPLTDTKQHGLWLIDNPPFKQAIREVFDSLNGLDVANLYDAIFYGGPECQNDTSRTFEKLLQQYGVKLEDLKQTDPQFAKDNPEVFTGDINLKNDNSAESQAYNNFIFKTLIGFFKDRIESLDRWAPQDPNVDFTSTKESINLLIENFQGKVDEYNENITSGKSIGEK